LDEFDKDAPSLSQIFENLVILKELALKQDEADETFDELVHFFEGTATI